MTSKENIWRDANANCLPPIDKEVIVLVQDSSFMDDEDYKVCFAHRPNPNGDAVTYGEGGWNIEGVKYWLDVDLPKNVKVDNDMRYIR